MYRKPRGSESASILNLDSLMDILSCLVGVMLFLVIYTVLELGTTSFEVSVPTPRDRPFESQRMFVVVNDETVRIMHADQPVTDLLANMANADASEIAGRVRQANLSPPSDAHFSYRLDFDEESAIEDSSVREFDIHVDAIPGEIGDSLAQLNSGSEFEDYLSDLDSDLVWVEFGVDSASVEVFRRARDIAEGLGFATRWGPLDLTFPVTYSLSDDRNGPSPRGARSKPQR